MVHSQPDLPGEQGAAVAVMVEEGGKVLSMESEAYGLWKGTRNLGHKQRVSLEISIAVLCKAQWWTAVHAIRTDECVLLLGQCHHLLSPLVSSFCCCCCGKVALERLIVEQVGLRFLLAKALECLRQRYYLDKA